MSIYAFEENHATTLAHIIYCTIFHIFSPLGTGLCGKKRICEIAECGRTGNGVLFVVLANCGQKMCPITFFDSPGIRSWNTTWQLWAWSSATIIKKYSKNSKTMSKIILGTFSTQINRKLRFLSIFWLIMGTDD